MLLDEGPVKVHKPWSLRHARGERLLIKGLPVPDVLVIVTCDPAIRLARLRAVDRLHARTLSDAEILSRDTGDKHARRFADARGVPVIEVDTSSGTDNSAALRQRLRSVVPIP